MGLRPGLAGVGFRRDAEPAGFGRGRAESAARWLPRVHPFRARGVTAPDASSASSSQTAPREGASQKRARARLGAWAAEINRVGTPDAPLGLAQSPAPAMIQKVEGPMGSSGPASLGAGPWGRESAAGCVSRARGVAAGCCCCPSRSGWSSRQVSVGAGGEQLLRGGRRGWGPRGPEAESAGFGWRAPLLPGSDARVGEPRTARAVLAAASGPSESRRPSGEELTASGSCGSAAVPPVPGLVSASAR